MEAPLTSFHSTPPTGDSPESPYSTESSESPKSPDLPESLDSTYSPDSGQLKRGRVYYRSTQNVYRLFLNQGCYSFIRPIYTWSLIYGSGCPHVTHGELT